MNVDTTEIEDVEQINKSHPQPVSRGYTRG